MSRRKIYPVLLAVLLVLALPLVTSAAISVTYTYNSQGRVHTAVYVNGTTSRTVTYSYDAAGNRSSVVAN